MEEKNNKNVYRVEIVSDEVTVVKHVLALDLNEGLKIAESEYEESGATVIGIKFICKIDLE